MEGFVFDLEAHGGLLAAGFATGLVSFGALLLVLVPVLRHRVDASMGKGFAGIAVSFIVLMGGAAVVYLLWPGAVLAYLVGELAAFFICWSILACTLMVRK